MKLPAYPLITCDPFFSIWSRTEKLYDSNTVLWCGIEKKLTGTVTVDGEKFRFLGKCPGKPIKQTALNIEPYTTEYVFENKKIRLTVTFWTPLLFSDLHVMSLPCSCIDYEVRSTDGQKHNVKIELTADGGFCYDDKKKKLEGKIFNDSFGDYGQLGQIEQKPLSKSGDGVSADWGYLYLTGGEISLGRGGCQHLKSVISFSQLDGAERESNIIAFDDIYSIEYFGEKLKGLWTEKFKTMGEALAFLKYNHDVLLDEIIKQGERIIKDGEKFGEGYVQILTSAARQVPAAHKLVRNGKGELLYLSKECHSNGCINTVDVSYPSIPMYLLYRPELVKAMMTGIFEFSRMKIWEPDYAPHDIGTYPIANGQIYALGTKDAHGQPVNKNEVYKLEDFDKYYYEDEQMPVEECGNMIIMSYAYYYVTGDPSQIKDNFDKLKEWADFLVDTGVVLDWQLCTDDFAGQSKKNVNLAIKEVMGIAAFGKICDALGIENDYFYKAKLYAESLTRLAQWKGYLEFSVGLIYTWSLKYNLVWDMIFGFNLFKSSIYANESNKYIENLNIYGVPLDCRGDFTKTDWMMWASCLDTTGYNTELFSKCMLAYLADAKDKYPFTDWYETKKPERKGFCHRSVQGGLWMPVLKDMIMNKGK